MNNNTDIILPSDERAATYRTDISGWVSREGRFFGEDERTARYDGATHGRCSCGGITSNKWWTQCDECRAVQEAEKYEAMPQEPWDGKAPLYSMGTDRYLFDGDDLEMLSADAEIQPAEMRLVFCEPAHFSQIDPDDYYEDQLPEDTYVADISGEVVEAFARLNEVLAKAPPLSWWPGKTRPTPESLPVYEVGQ